MTPTHDAFPVVVFLMAAMLACVTIRMTAEAAPKIAPWARLAAWLTGLGALIIVTKWVFDFVLTYGG